MIAQLLEHRLWIAIAYRPLEMSLVVVCLTERGGGEKYPSEGYVELHFPSSIMVQVVITQDDGRKDGRVQVYIYTNRA